MVMLVTHSREGRLDVPADRAHLTLGTGCVRYTTRHTFINIGYCTLKYFEQKEYLYQLQSGNCFHLVSFYDKHFVLYRK